MVAFPRPSETLIFVRGARKELPEDTVTEVITPGARRKNAKLRSHAPPKPRTTDEGELPSIMVHQESWVPPTPPRAPSLEATVVGVRRPRLPDPRRTTAAAASPREMSTRRYNLTLAFVALGLGLLCLYLAPLLSGLMDAAFTTLNR
jgi:hypothetical protein